MIKAIKNCNIVLPDRILCGKTILFNEKIIGFTDDNEVSPDCEISDAGSGYVLPGFVDIHVHGGGGSDFLDSDENAIDTVTEAHAEHGTTSLLATTLTCPDEILFDGLKRIAEKIESGTKGAQILGIHLEGPYFSPTSKGAQAVKEQKIPTYTEVEKIYSLAKGHIVRFDAAPELPSMDFFASWLKEKGIYASIGHSSANAETALEFFAKGFTHITHMYCSTTTEHKEGQVVHAGIIEAAYLEDGFTVELIGDGNHIPKETMQLVFKLKGVKKTALITDAMRAAGTDVKESILGEKTTGTPVDIEDGVAKLKDRSSFAGSIATMDRVLKTALCNGIRLEDAVRSITLTPCELIGFDKTKGSLEKGKDADILICDTDFNVSKVFICGKQFK